MWLLFFLLSFPTFISIYATNTDNEDLYSLAFQLKDLEAAIDDEIQETKSLVNLIEERSLSQRATSGKTLIKMISCIIITICNIII